MLASSYYSSTFPSLLLRFTFFKDEDLMWEECHRLFSKFVQCMYCISWCTLLQYPRIYVLRAPLSYKEHLWLVGIFCSTRPVVAGDGVYIERMELCIGYYRGVSDVHLDIRHTSNDDRHCSKIRNNQILRNIKIWPYKYCFILHSLYSFQNKK